MYNTYNAYALSLNTYYITYNTYALSLNTYALRLHIADSGHI